MAEWTRQAGIAAGWPFACDLLVFDQHKDWMLRNMLLVCSCVGVCGCSAGSADDARKANEFRSNLDHKPWPTYEDVQQWATSEGALSATGEDGTANTGAMNAALMAAIDEISEGTGLPYYEVDADGVTVYYEADGVTVTTEALGGVPTVAKVPQRVFLATVMQAARLYTRRQSQNGTLGASAFGGVARVSGMDSDVRKLLRNYWRVGIA